MPPFVHQDKSPGDLIRSADWNLVGNEIVRLGADKISRAGEESLEGPLTVRGTLNVAGTAANGVGLSLKGELTVGTPTAGAAVRILRRQEDGKAATDGALVLGTASDSSGALRMGYYSTYSWLQGQGQQDIAINPHGGNVGIGTGTTAPASKLHVAGDVLVSDGTLRFGNRSALRPDQGGSLELGGDNETAGTGTPYIDFHFANEDAEDFNVRLINDGDKRLTLFGVLKVTGNLGVGVDVPVSRLAVAGGATVGAGYAAMAAPGDGLLVQGNVGIGVPNPTHKLHVNGDTVWNETVGQRFILHTRGGADGDFMQITTDDAKGDWEFGTKGITMRRTGNVGIGATDPQARLHVAGGDLRLDAARSLAIGDNARLTAAANGVLTVTAPVVSLGCYDFNIGHTSRRGSPGRALVDNTSTLVLNYGSDWAGGVVVNGRLQTASGREIRTASNSLTLTATNWTALNDMSLKITTLGNPVLVMFKTGGVQASGGTQSGQFRLLVAGVQVAYTKHEFHNEGWELRDVSLTWLATNLPAGTHEVKVEWAASNKLFCCLYNDTRHLIAVEL